MATTETRELDDVLHEVLKRVDAGEPVDRDAILAEYPEYAAELTEFFAGESLVERMAGPVMSTANLQGAETIVPASSGSPANAADPTTGPAGDPSTATSEPTVFGRYRLLKTLGEGAMGSVHLAEDTTLGREVALKLPKFGDDDPEMIERFQTEARTAATLRHVGICPVFDVGEIDGKYFITMAYIPGRPLSDYAASRTSQPVRQVVKVVRKLCLALHAAHEAGVVHRDVKPANIMIDEQGEPVVMDFGLARQTQGTEVRLTRSGAVMGTPAYMSPEQVEGRIDDVGPASDQFSLGGVLYEMLTGELPFLASSVGVVMSNILNKPADPPSLRRPEVDPELDTICLRMLSKQADQRYGSLRDVAELLTDWLRRDKDRQVDGGADPSLTAPFVRISEPASPETVPPKPATVEKPVVAVTPEPKRRPKNSRQPSQQPSKQRQNNRTTWLLAGLGGTAALVLGLVFLLSTPEGTLRVEVEEGANVEVLVDGKSIQLTDSAWQGEKSAKIHRLSFKIGGVLVPFDEKQKRFVAANGKVSVLLGGTALGAESFEVSRKGTTVLKITFEPTPDRPVPLDEDGWKNVFDGKSLDGWTVFGTADWSVDDGEIVCRGRDSKLVCDVGPLTDFEVRFECRLGPGTNSGLFLRTGRNADQADGYEVQLADFAKYGTGSIWDRAPFDESIVEESTWFPVAVRVRGNEIVVNVNDRETVRYTDPEGDYPNGYIALQGHRGRGEVRFRKVALLRHDDTTGTDAPSPPVPTTEEPVVVQDGWAYGESQRLELPFEEEDLSEGDAATDARGLTMVFHRDGPRDDLWMTERESIDQPWPQAVRLPDPINSKDHDSDPVLSADGLVLAFSTNRFGDDKRAIFIARRDRRGTPWGEPEQAEYGIGGHPLALTNGGRRLFYEPSTYALTRIADWDDKVGGFRDGRNDNTEGLGKAALRCFSDDELVHVYTAVEPGKKWFIRVQQRASTDAPWGPPADVLQVGGWISRPQLTNDGRAILYSRFVPTRKPNPETGNVDYQSDVFVIPRWSADAERPTSGTDVAQLRRGVDPGTAAVDNGTDRAIAVRIIALGGIVRVVGGKQNLTHVDHLPEGAFRLEFVSFRGQDVGVRNEHVAMLKELPRLEHLEFGPNDKMTDDGFVQLADLDTVTELNFVRSPIGDRGLAALTGMRQLSLLELYHTDVTDAGLKVLAKFPKLDRLTIGHGRKEKYGPHFITDAGLVHLRSIEKLYKLWVIGAVFTDATVEHLTACGKLHNVMLATPSISDEAFDRLEGHLKGGKLYDKRGSSDDDH